MPRLVAARFGGALEPGNRFVKAILFDQVGPDVVVGVAKIGIDFNGALAFGDGLVDAALEMVGDRKSTRLNSSHGYISYAVFCLKKKKNSSRSYVRICVQDKPESVH